MNFIKGLLGVGLLVSAIYTGFANFPLWSILLLSLLFTAAYIQGKWYLWHRLFQQQNRQLYQSLLVTYLIQAVVVFVFYLLGSGVARLLNR
ncbi:hypothetical protein [Aliterella atlantica]|uniref:Uncharacterized protein n=1 Tax=Aliterella atlantica CENA595 TaxID=1618023 RepID=A0A0D8ZQX8_9CYAN|nr:hypothetical protein [Aliterella atlantica]KJH69631.1 hypothetical protein UH38_22635 [Aliterella atlantica CENA595]